MTFASPLLLLALLPWTALAIWLLFGHREGVQVPFLKLWPSDLPRPRSQRSIRMPPPALVFLLLAILLAILAGAGPMLRGAGGWRLAVVIDRHVTLSARLRELIRKGGELTHGMAGTADVFLVPGGRQSGIELADWTRSIAAIQASTLPTFESLQQVVRDALRAEYDAVLLISNQSIGLDNERLTQLAPESPIRNAGIIAVAARRDQAMVRLRGGDDVRPGELIVSSNGKSQLQPIEWAAQGGETTVFVDLPEAGQVVSFELMVDDEIPADNRAWLVRQRGWPSVELRGNASQEVVRMIETYGSHRRAGDESIRVIVTDTAEARPQEGPVVTVANAATEQQAGEIEVVPHPITADVDWKRIGAQVRLADAPQGWTALVTKGGLPLVAVTEAPVRRVWVGFDAPLWGASTDFVVFWSNVLDWAGGGGDDGYISERVHVVGDEWKRSDDLSGSSPPQIDPAPGVYRRSDGGLRALNCVDLSVPPAPGSVTSRGLLTGSPSTVNVRSLAGVSCVAALGCALAAALHWPVPARKNVPT